MTLHFVSHMDEVFDRVLEPKTRVRQPKFIAHPSGLCESDASA